MRILIMSDAHGISHSIISAIENEPKAELVYYLGDGADVADDVFEAFRDKKMFIVLKGNCDMGTRFPDFDIRTIEGVKIYACHGHNESVKYTRSVLSERARSNNCTVALFGHTHQGFEDYEDGLYLFNPGSLLEKQYGVLDIEKNGILFTQKKLSG